MKRSAMGVVAGLAVWFGSAFAAEAQQITPTGPLKIQVTDTTETYTATITVNTSFWFYLTVFKNGSVVYGGQWFCITGGPSFNFTSPALNSAAWGMNVGDTIDFHAIAQVSAFQRTTSNYNLTVQSGGTSMAPRQDLDSLLAEAVPTRKEDLEEVAAAIDGSNA
ncbi:MAG TPA: hypothetical protein VKW04_05120 [Planctomycetota bacterium]|nr:hypothetical protein [Planctomycetota bacterium]